VLGANIEGKKVLAVEHDLEHKKFAYYVNDIKYESDLPELTGAQIKARVPDLQPGTQLSLEGHGHDPDQIIGDDEVVRLETEHGPARFTLVPPATFG